MDVEKFLSDNNLAPKRGMDQYFVRDESVLAEEIKLAGLSEKDVVLEIGAGIGNLTEKIAEKCRVMAVEKDARFIPFLGRIKNAEAVKGDALSVIKERKFNKIVSNIPYSISQPLLLELLKRKWETAVLIVQKEFAEKIAGNSKLSVLVNDCCDFSIEYFVPGGSFYPPAPDSAIILLRQRKTMDEELWKFLSRIFVQKNRNVRNVIKNCPAELAGKKVHQLCVEEIKALHELNKQ